MKSAQRIFAVVQKDRLRDFQFQPGSGESRSAERAPDVFDRRSAAELRRREIDRYRNMRGPLRRFHAGLFDDPRAERDDQPRLFRHADKLIRQHEAAPRMSPAYESLKRAGVLRHDVVEGLVVHLELASGQGIAKFGLDGAAFPYAGAHFGFVETPAAGVFGLGTVLGDIGILHQLHRIGAVGRSHGNPDRGCGNQTMTVDFAGFADCLQYPFRQHGGLFRMCEVCLDDGELIAIHAGDHIAMPDTESQPLPDGPQQIIADGMPHRVVNQREVVEIHQQNSEAHAGSELCQRLGKPRLECSPVKQSGQGIVIRQKSRSPVFPPPCDVARHSAVAKKGAVAVVKRVSIGFQPRNLAIGLYRPMNESAERPPGQQILPMGPDHTIICCIGLDPFQNCPARQSIAVADQAQVRISLPQHVR